MHAHVHTKCASCHQCKLQVMTTMSASEVLAIIDDRKTPPQVAEDQDHRWHYSRSRMQQPNAGSTRARFCWGMCTCASCNWLLHPAPTSQDGLDLLQLALVVVYLPLISTKTHWCWWSCSDYMRYMYTFVCQVVVGWC